MGASPSKNQTKSNLNQLNQSSSVNIYNKLNSLIVDTEAKELITKRTNCETSIKDETKNLEKLLDEMIKLYADFNDLKASVNYKNDKLVALNSNIQKINVDEVNNDFKQIIEERNSLHTKFANISSKANSITDGVNSIQDRLNFTKGKINEIQTPQFLKNGNEDNVYNSERLKLIASLTPVASAANDVLKNVSVITSQSKLLYDAFERNFTVVASAVNQKNPSNDQHQPRVMRRS